MVLYICIHAVHQSSCKGANESVHVYDVPAYLQTVDGIGHVQIELQHSCWVDRGHVQPDAS